MSELRKWKLELSVNGNICIVGTIYNDEKNRFPDGARVHTSRLGTIDFTTMEAWTKNTLYKLIDME